jgi:hypothetical protein
LFWHDEPISPTIGFIRRSFNEGGRNGKNFSKPCAARRSASVHGRKERWYFPADFGIACIVSPGLALNCVTGALTKNMEVNCEQP